MNPKDTMTVLVKPEHIAEAAAKLLPCKDKDGRKYFSATGENNPAALAIRARLSHTPAGKAWIAVWTGFAQIGTRVYKLPGIVDNRESIFLQHGTCEPYDFEMPREPLPIVKDPKQAMLL